MAMDDSTSDSLHDFTSMDIRDVMSPKREGIASRYQHLLNTKCSRQGKASSETFHFLKQGQSTIFKTLSWWNMLLVTSHSAFEKNTATSLSTWRFGSIAIPFCNQNMVPVVNVNFCWDLVESWVENFHKDPFEYWVSQAVLGNSLQEMDNPNQQMSISVFEG